MQRSQDRVHLLDGAAPVVYLDQTGSLYLYDLQLAANSSSGSRHRPATASDATPKAPSAGRSSETDNSATWSKAAQGTKDASEREDAVSGSECTERLRRTPVEQHATASEADPDHHSDDHTDDGDSSLKHSVLAALRTISKVSC